jgi:hypothetical protein
MFEAVANMGKFAGKMQNKPRKSVEVAFFTKTGQVQSFGSIVNI